MPPDGIESLTGESADKKDESLAALEERIQRSEDQRLEERFYWFFGIIFLLDIAILPDIDNWGSSLALLVLEVIALVLVGRKCGVDDISMLTDRILDTFSGRKR